MNPFLESTVAKPRPGARWQQASRQKASTASEPQGTHPSASQNPGRAVGRKRASRTRLRRVGRILRVLTLAGSLLMPAAVLAVDINTATAEQLLEVKGIGPKMARVIIEERERGGGFASLEDVSDRVKGIGPKKAAAMQASGLTVGAAKGAATSTSGGTASRVSSAGATRRNR